jgi:hypothetical protein
MGTLTAVAAPLLLQCVWPLPCSFSSSVGGVAVAPARRQAPPGRNRARAGLLGLPPALLRCRLATPA